MFSLTSFSQESRNQIEFILENDKFSSVDKYYTNGLFLSYKRIIENDFIFKNKEDNRLQLSFVFGNEIYTPTELSSFDASDFDRPFAGWFFLKTVVTNIKDNSLLELALETGVTGEQSFSGDLQTWFHDFLGIGDFPTWEQQIENKFVINLKSRYLYNAPIKSNQSFQYAVESSVGTKDIFLENGIGYYLGKLQTFKNSSRTNSVTDIISNEFYGFVNLSHTYVLHNTLIQGSLDHDDETFTTARTPHIVRLKLGVVLKLKKNTYRILYNFNTKETPDSTAHSYGTITYSRNF